MGKLTDRGYADSLGLGANPDKTKVRGFISGAREAMRIAPRKLVTLSAITIALELVGGAANAQPAAQPPPPARTLPIEKLKIAPAPLPAPPGGVKPTTIPPGMKAPPPPAQVTVGLEDTINLALNNSPTLRQARARVVQARGQAIQAGLYPNPRMDTGNPQQLGGTQSLYNAGLAQEWVRAGKIRMDRAAAEQALRQAELDLVRARFDLLTSVRSQFYVVLASERRAALTKQLLQIARESERVGSELQRAGQGSEIDLLLLRVERQRAEAAVQTSEATAGGARRQLAALLGLPELRIARSVGNLEQKLPDFENLALRRDLLERNAMIGSARAEIVRSRILLERARVEPIPNITWTGGYQWTVAQSHNQALVMATFDIPIFDRNQGNILSASGRVREAVASLSALENDLVRQIAGALARYRAAMLQIGVFEREVLPTASRTLSLVEAGYRAGELDFLRFLQTQREYFQVTLDYINAQETRWQAAAEIAGLLQLEQFP